MPADSTLDALFTNIERILGKLGSPFTGEAFIKQVARDQPTAYIDVLAGHRTHQTPFIAAHADILAHLDTVAPAHGWDRAEEPTLDADMFGVLTKTPVYFKR